MKKTLDFTITGVKIKLTAEYDGHSESTVVIDMDTAIGMALDCSLMKAKLIERELP